MGAGLCGMGARFPKGAEGERQYSDLGHCVCDGSANGRRGGGGGVVAGCGEEREGEEREGEDGGTEEGRGGEKGVVM